MRILEWVRQRVFGLGDPEAVEAEALHGDYVRHSDIRVSKGQGGKGRDHGHRALRVRFFNRNPRMNRQRRRASNMKNRDHRRQMKATWRTLLCR